MPVDIVLEARESINSKYMSLSKCLQMTIVLLDQGTLRVDLLEGKGIRGVDRGGKFLLHSARVE